MLIWLKDIFGTPFVDFSRLTKYIISVFFVYIFVWFNYTIQEKLNLKYIYKYNLWIGNNTGYIQNKKDDKIYKLNSNENKFFIDCFLKYYNEEDIRKIISNKF